MIAAHPKAALFSADKLSAPPPQGKPDAADIAKDAAAGLVAPPRSVTDISAVLDQQKPDPAATAALAATADAVVPTGLKGAELAAFYYKRAQARVLIGRADALDDAELAVSNAQGGSDYKNLGSRYEQLLMRLLREAGQTKRANVLLAKQLAFANQTERKIVRTQFRNCERLFEKRRHKYCGIIRRAQSRVVDGGTAVAEISDIRDGLASFG